MPTKDFSIDRLRDLFAAVGEFAPALLLIIERLSSILKRPIPTPTPTVKQDGGAACAACCDAALEAQLEAMAALLQARRCCGPEDEA